jgi:hypothetical protein
VLVRLCDSLKLRRTRFAVTVSGEAALPEARKHLGRRSGADFANSCASSLGRSASDSRKSRVGLWGMTMLLALLATVGFAALNISDTTAIRSEIASESERALLTERIEQLRTQHAAITETRPPNTPETELQRAQPGAGLVWPATSGCRDITLASSAEACATVLALRTALQTAQRR